MTDWEKNKIKEVIKEGLITEQRQFMVAYGELAPKYAGFLQALPQKQKIWYKEIDSEFLKELQKEYGWKKVSAWNGSTYFTFELPYLGIDGHLVMFKDNTGKDISSIVTDIIEISNKLLVKATIICGLHIRVAYYEVPPLLDGKKPVFNTKGEPIYSNIEIPMAQAVKKALDFLGYGRFPTQKTRYGESTIVKEFREFKQHKSITNDKKASNAVKKKTITKEK